MAETTKISWTDHTFNPWIGCQAVSPGCDHCYAETLSNQRRWTQWGPGGERKRTAPSTWKLPRRWDRAAERAGARRRVFCASLADVFDNQAPQGAREDLFELIRQTPHLNWQLLTKRPQNLRDMLPPDWGRGYPNVWLGVSAEDQTEYDRRWPVLAATPAGVRFISYEPALGAVTLYEHERKPDWVIWGGESGPECRPMEPRWAREITRECLELGIAVFGKQWGSYGNNPVVAEQGLPWETARGLDPQENGKGGALLNGSSGANSQNKESELRLEILKLLADRGAPLVLHTEEVPDGLLIGREGHPYVTMKGRYAMRELRNSLAHYPREVTIDGIVLEISPPPGYSQVSILRPAGMDTIGQAASPMDLGGKMPGAGLNTLAAGVLVHMKKSPYEKAINEGEYLSGMPAHAHHHRRLAHVHLTTLMEIAPDELDELDDSANIPRQSTLKDRMRGRVREVEERTMALPGMPEQYQGRTYAYALVGNQGDRNYVRPTMIEVTGVPLLVNQTEYGTDGEFTSAVQAMYDNDTILVPVDPNEGSDAGLGEDQDMEATASVEFEMHPADAGRLERVERITMSLVTDGGRHISTPARFHLSGEFEDDITVRTVPGSMDLDELAEVLMRTFWREEDWSSRHEEEYARIQAQAHMRNIATHALGNNRLAIEQELSAFLNGFHTNVPSPDSPVTVTGKGGRLTITMNPEPRTAARPGPAQKE